METLSRTKSRNLYSWWWDSHTSPKNSKWLQENIADMDMKVKAMIKLLDEDADSFARKAEMYFKKRPDLLKLVEEFYRTYRALAERYDHATGALRQAHRTVAEVLSKQLPLVHPDDPLSSKFSAFDRDLYAHDTTLPAFNVLLDDDEEEDYRVQCDNGSKKSNGGRVRKGLSFDKDGRKHANDRIAGQLRCIQDLHSAEREDVAGEIRRLQDEISQLSTENMCLDGQRSSESQRADKAETEAKTLKGELSKLNSENEDALLQYGLSLEKITSLESEISRIREEIDGLNEDVLTKHKMLSGAEDRYLHLEKEKLSVHSLLDAAETQRHELVEQLEAIRFRLESSHAEVEELQVRNKQLNYASEKHENEKAALRKELQGMARISDENLDLKHSFSNAISEIRGLKEKIKSLEESLESLSRRIAVHISENAALISQVDHINQKMEGLLLDNETLENATCDANVEIDSFRGKSRDLEETCQLLSQQKLNLVSEKNALLSQVEEISQYLESLEARHAELEEKSSVLLMQRDQALEQTMNLQNLLQIEKVEHENIIQSSKNQMDTLENKLYLLEEECRLRAELVEHEQRNIAEAQLEIFVLRECLRDMQKGKVMLTAESQRNMERSIAANELISELSREICIRDNRLGLLLDQNAWLRGGIAHMLEEFRTDEEYASPGITDDGVLMKRIHDEIKGLVDSLASSRDENQNLILQNTVIVTFLKQLGLDLEDLKLESFGLKEELGIRNNDLFSLHNKVVGLLELNGRLNNEVQTQNTRANFRGAEMEMVCGQLSDLMNTNKRLEEDNGLLVEEAAKLDHLAMIFRSLSSEKTFEMISLGKDMECQHRIRGKLAEKLKLIHEKLGVLESDITPLEFMSTLDRADIRLASNRISGMLEDCARKDGEIALLNQSKEMLTRENNAKEIEITHLKQKEDRLTIELQKCELEIAKLLDELHIATVDSALFQDKLLEVIVSCEERDIQSMVLQEMLKRRGNSLSSRVVYLKESKEQMLASGEENGATKAKNATCMALESGITYLKDGIASLEEFVSLARQQDPYNHKKQDDSCIPKHHDKRGGDRIATFCKAGISEWQKLLARVAKLCEMAMETGNLFLQGVLDSGANSPPSRGSLPHEDIELDINSYSHGIYSNSSKPSEITMSEQQQQVLQSWEEPGGEWRRRVIGRLDIDAEKLSILRTSAKKLRVKMESPLNDGFTRVPEYENMEGKLKEAERAILEMIDTNGELKEKAVSSYGSSGGDEKALRRATRRTVLAHARDGSERIRRLEMELEKIEDALLKLKEGQDFHGTRNGSRSRVTLREYLYGQQRRRRSWRQKRASFFRCATLKLLHCVLLGGERS